MEIKASDYPEVYANLGIDTGRLGCIMLDTEPIIISNIIDEQDYYYADPKDKPYAQGNVSESVPHVTLLYGLMRSGKELAPHVTAVMTGWRPEPIRIDEVSFFYGDNGEYITVIALLEVTDNLSEAHQRLSLLPHINTFGIYKPHLTLAYIKSSSDWEGIVNRLSSELAGKEIDPLQLNLGD